MVIPARNAEKYIGKTLKHLLKQTVNLDEIVVVDDGSTDCTPVIARSYNVEVISVPDRGWNATGMPQLAAVLNIGIKHCLEKGYEYVMVLGGDDILPEQYVEKILHLLREDSKLVVASGIVEGEESVATWPRGGGRIYKAWFLRKVGLYPINYGWETYPVLKAVELGFRAQCFPILFTSLKRTSISPKKYYGLGKGMKALGYDPLYALGRCALSFLKSPKASISMFGGYVSSDVQKYADLSDFTAEWQRRIVWKRILEIIKRRGKG